MTPGGEKKLCRPFSRMVSLFFSTISLSLLRDLRGEGRRNWEKRRKTIRGGVKRKTVVKWGHFDEIENGHERKGKR